MGQYLMKLIAAAILCAIATGLAGGETGAGKVVRLMASVFMVATILSPLVRLELTDLDGLLEGISADASAAAAAGENGARESMAQIIKSETEAYILDKAESYGAQLAVEVTLTDSGIPTPVSVTLRGQFSPYARQQLTRLIEEGLEIGQEEQTWIAQG